MDITCWNCKTVTTLDKTAVEAAIAAMDASKLGFHDIACASCGKSNRTARDAFEAGLKAFAVAAPAPTRVETAKKTKDKEEDPKHRGKEWAKAKEQMKKVKKKG